MEKIEFLNLLKDSEVLNETQPCFIECGDKVLIKEYPWVVYQDIKTSTYHVLPSDRAIPNSYHFVARFKSKKSAIDFAHKDRKSFNDNKWPVYFDHEKNKYIVSESGELDSQRYTFIKSFEEYSEAEEFANKNTFYKALIDNRETSAEEDKLKQVGEWLIEGKSILFKPKSSSDWMSFNEVLNKHDFLLEEEKPKKLVAYFNASSDEDLTEKLKKIENLGFIDSISFVDNKE